MVVTDKKVLVFGSGISGIGAAKLLNEQHAQVILYDSNGKLDTKKAAEQFSQPNQIQILFGELPMEELRSLDMVVLSPGVPLDLPVVQQMRDLSIPIVGEVELAFQLSLGDVLAITGTNGKTTTTALLGEIMKAYCQEVFVVGNIGNPYTEIAARTTKDTIIVAEMSSFQLESIDKFRPMVSAVLNITPDHLNRHHTMAAYIDAKFHIAQNQTKADYCILNYEDEITREFGKKVEAKVLYFSSKRKLEQGIYLDDQTIVYKEKKDRESIVVCQIPELQVLGAHNYENVMAAAAMAIVYGVPLEVIQRSLRAFKGVEHRIEYVTEKAGVAYYNDSKGTNPDAAIKGIQAMNRKTVLIGGGYDKDSSYREWIQSFDGKVKKLVLVGATKEKIAEDAKACGFHDYQFAETFEEAVLTSAKLADSGEAVLLSPACASWGMFPNYETRGEKFKEIVNSL